MNAFYEEIGGEKKVVGRAAGPVDCAVVADAEDHRRMRGDLRESLETVGDGALALQG
jgi:hypothetical protein